MIAIAIGSACLAVMAGLMLVPFMTEPEAQERSGQQAAAPEPPPTFAVEYTISVSAARPHRARVDWRLAGAEEVDEVRLEVEDRFTDFQATGRLQAGDAQLRWLPGGSYGRLRYTVDLDHRRQPEGGYDSYAGKDWIITRTDDLLPDTQVRLRYPKGSSPEARVRIRFRLPRGWRSVTAMPRLSRHTYAVERDDQRWDRPFGWVGLGRLRTAARHIAGTRVTIAQAPNAGLPASAVLRLYEKVFPELRDLFGRLPPSLLIVSAGDPMWRGGLSGERSFYIHGQRPLFTPDKTSPYLHEAFHVFFPLRAGADGLWVTEGLAEYYALELPRRAGRLSPARFARGIELFARYGQWNLDISSARRGPATNNSAPLLMYALDRQIQQRTGGSRRLDDAVRLLVAQPDPVTTARFLRALNQVASGDFSHFFSRHVYRGRKPTVPPPTPSAEG